jgi:TolA-binding protein
MAGEASDLQSPGPADASDTSTQPHAKRRRTAQAQSNATNATSSRGVANLTPEQLARKRANDREAQRAIRERTKTQIDQLNRRIRELESQRPYHDLQLVVREKDAVLAENADIRKRLESVLSILGPIVRGTSGLNGEWEWRRGDEAR